MFKALALPAMEHCGTCPPLELARLRPICQFLFISTSPVGSGRLVVKITHFPVPATDSQSLRTVRSHSGMHLSEQQKGR